MSLSDSENAIMPEAPRSFPFKRCVAHWAAPDPEGPAQPEVRYRELLTL
jgi:hypothetical protein